MILHDVGIYGEQGHHHIHVHRGKITAITPDGKREQVGNDETHVELNGAIAMPGFINSHDHLDFNLFPQLGGRTYNSYTEWGPYIRETHKALIRQVQSIPLALRVSWGLYKNMLNGFTTVVNHGEKLRVTDEPVSVFQDCHSLHSPAFEKEWKWKINNPFRIRQPMVMHMGEGIDEAAAHEIDEVATFNRIGRSMVAVHGVAMNVQQAEKFSGLVWCPASNYFLLGKTAEVAHLKKTTRVVFGTDSALTSPWNCWKHFRQALEGGLVSDKELADMLTRVPADLWGMEDRGAIGAGKSADLLVVNPPGNVFDGNPRDILLVVQQGKIRVADERIAGNAGLSTAGLSKVQVGGVTKWVHGDLPGLVTAIKEYYPAFETPFDDA